jgi:Ala-tRNA(Pro) deacylase
VRECFPDCDAGAVPALGPAYGLDTIWDDGLLERSDLYFDAGDHEPLLHVSTTDFAGMLGRGWHDRFGKRFLA